MKLVLSMIAIFSLIPFALLPAAGKTQIIAESGHRISITIAGLENQVVSLGYYFGEKQYSKDSIRLDADAMTLFQGEKPLPGGVYLIVFPNKMWIEFIAGDDQHFELKTAANNPIGAMTITGSEENSIFYDYQKAMGQLQNIQKQMENALKEEPGDIEIAAKKNEVETEITKMQMQIIEGRPDYLLSKIINMMRTVPTPDFPRDARGVVLDSNWKSYYERRHYFDRVDWNDDRIVRTPVFYRLLDRYFNKYVPQHQDTLVREIDRVLGMATHPELFKYVLLTLFNRYRDSKILGMERVPYHMYTRYYKGGKADWVNQEFLDDWDKRIANWHHNLHGDTLQDFALNSPEGNIVSLREIQSPLVVLVFWDPECSHCKQYLPGIVALHKEFSDRVTFVGINTMREYDKWISGIRDNQLTWINLYDAQETVDFRVRYDIAGTPMMYLLNENDVVLWKRIPPQNLREIIVMELENLKKKGQ